MPSCFKSMQVIKAASAFEKVKIFVKLSEESFELLTFKVRAGSTFEKEDPTLSWLVICYYYLYSNNYNVYC